MAPSKSSDVDHRHDNIADKEENDIIALEMHVGGDKINFFCINVKSMPPSFCSSPWY